MQASNELSTYHYHGQEGENVPDDVETLIVDACVSVLPDHFFSFRSELKEVHLAEGLREIGTAAFYECVNLKDIEFPSTLETIGERAFLYCFALTRVHFTEPSSSFQRIKERAFTGVPLRKFTSPSSMRILDRHVFADCYSLLEVNLGFSRLCEIPSFAFEQADNLQAVRLPSSVKRIACYAFYDCPNLVTVEVISSPNRHPICVEKKSFFNCKSLANIRIFTAQGKVDEAAFDGCILLHEYCGTRHDEIIHGQARRFDEHPVHHLCYHSSTTTVEELRRCINSQGNLSLLVTDNFDMTPFHILCSSVEPRQDLFLVLLDNGKCPAHYNVLGWKDTNGKRAMDYLITNWSPETANLFRVAMQRWIIGSWERWGATAGLEDMEGRIEAILDRSVDKDLRQSLFNDTCSAFEYYAIIETMSLLELAIWKQKNLEVGESRREECRLLCQTDMVLANVGAFLGFVQS